MLTIWLMGSLVIGSRALKQEGGSWKRTARGDVGTIITPLRLRTDQLQGFRENPKLPENREARKGSCSPTSANAGQIWGTRRLPRTRAAIDVRYIPGLTQDSGGNVKISAEGEVLYLGLFSIRVFVG
jgi:hypothetical protein